MRAPIWLPLDVVLAMHGQLLSRFGGAEGIRDKGLLESALARPQQLCAYGEPTLFLLGATYAHGVVKNHPFVDGNKRTAFMAAYTFLGVNGYRLTAPEEEAVVYTLRLASGDLEAEDYAGWLEGGCEVRE